jgi:hypothetical protein
MTRRMNPTRAAASSSVSPVTLIHKTWNKEHMMIQNFLSRLPDRFKMTLHNVVGHPVSELLFLFGFIKMSTAVHDGTLP